MNVLYAECPLCWKVGKIGHVKWTFPRSGKTYEMPRPICFKCGYGLSKAREIEIVKLLDMIHVEQLIHDLQQEANNHGA